MLFGKYRFPTRERSEGEKPTPQQNMSGPFACIPRCAERATDVIPAGATIVVAETKVGPELGPATTRALVVFLTPPAFQSIKSV